MEKLAEAFVTQRRSRTRPALEYQLVHDDQALNQRLLAAGATLVIELVFNDGVLSSTVSSSTASASSSSQPPSPLGKEPSDALRFQLSRPTNFTVYLSNFPHSLQLSVRDGLLRLQPRTSIPSLPSTLTLDSITDIVIGKRGGSFPMDASSDCCFSLGTTRVRLDLEAQVALFGVLFIITV